MADTDHERSNGMLNHEVCISIGARFYFPYNYQQFISHRLPLVGCNINDIMQTIHNSLVQEYTAAW